MNPWYVFDDSSVYVVGVGAVVVKKTEGTCACI
jgi:hypothetical protein